MSSSTGRRIAAKALAGITAVAVGAVGSLLIFPGPASAATKPKPNYTAGTDKATFAVTGVLDSNCLVSVGGNDVFIKPGDKIDFNSSIVGISLGSALGPVASIVQLLGTTLADVVGGLNVTAKIDKHSFTVAAGKTTHIPTSWLGKGNHKLSWTATSIGLLPLLGLPTSVPLYSSALKSGAKLSWTGEVHVTTSAPQCKLAVSTPHTQITVGGKKVIDLPGVTVGVPEKIPNLTTVTGGGKPSTKPAKTTKPKSSTTTNKTPTAVKGVLPIPAQVVPGLDSVLGTSSGSSGSGGGGGGSSSLSFANSTFGTPAVLKTTGTAQPKASNSAAGKTKTVNVADSRPASTSGMPVILAIVAMLALVLVAGTYARLFLLRKGPDA